MQKPNRTTLIRSRIPSFIESCYDPKSGGFFEIPNDIICKNDLKRFPGINQTSSAHWMLFNLQIPTELVCGIKEKNCQKRIIEFLHFHKVEKEGWVSYRNSINDENPWVCSLYYAERISRQMKIQPTIDNIIGMYRFILDAKQPESGFSAGGSKMKPNIIHTKDAISLIKRYFGEYSNKFIEINTITNPKLFIIDIINDVTSFIKNAYFKGGFSIAEPSHYLPNIYATRMGYDIVRYFKYFNENFNFNIPNFDFLSPDDTLNYIESCYDAKEGGFK